MNFFRSVLILALCAFFALPCCAGSFRDTCSSMSDEPSRQLENLNSANKHLENLQISLNDRTAFSVTDYSQDGQLTYEVDRADEIVVSLYRHCPDFAVRAFNPQTMLTDTIYPGFSLQHFKQKSEIIPVWIDEGAQADGEEAFLYCIDGDSYYTLGIGNDGYLQFIPSEKPERTLRPYGLDIQASSDGKNFESCPMELSLGKTFLAEEDFSCNSIFEENFHADLPSGTTHVRIILQQFPNLTISDTPIYEAPEYAAMIRNVAFLGDNAPVPDQTEPEEKPDSPIIIIQQESKPKPEEDKDKDKKPSSDNKNDSKKPEKDSVKVSSSSAKPSSSSDKKTSSGGSVSTVDSSQQSTTTDSNNTSSTTNTYTTNYFFVGMSEEGSAALQKALEGMGVAVNDSEKAAQTAQKEAQDVITVLYDDELTVGSSGKTPVTAGKKSPPDTEQKEPKNPLLYLLILGIGAIITLQIIIILRSPKKEEKEHLPDQEKDDDDDTTLF